MESVQDASKSPAVEHIQSTNFKERRMFWSFAHSHAWVLYSEDSYQTLQTSGPTEWEHLKETDDLNRSTKLRRDNRDERVKRTNASSSRSSLAELYQKYDVRYGSMRQTVQWVIMKTLENETTWTIGCWSHTLKDAEIKYNTAWRQCIAIVCSVRILRPYFERAWFNIRTARDSFKWIIKLTGNTARLARWRLRLSKYGFAVAHRVAVKYQAAHALSRQRTYKEDQTHLEDDLYAFAIHEQESGERDVHVFAEQVNENTPLRATEEQILDSPFTENEPLIKQKHVDFCQLAVLQVKLTKFEFSVYNRGILVSRLIVDESMKLLYREYSAHAFCISSIAHR